MLEIIEQNNLAEQKVLVSGPDFTVEGVKPLSRCTFAIGFAISRPSGRGSRDVLTQRGKSRVLPTNSWVMNVLFVLIRSNVKSVPAPYFTNCLAIPAYKIS